MKVSLNWLKDYVDIKSKPNQLARELTLRSLEVNTIEKKGELYEKLVVGKVLKVEKHPGADRLSVVKVDMGKKLLEIVCGAPNIREGQKVVVAKAGSSVFSANGEKITIKKVNIRGVKSEGMICSEKELGLGEDQTGIMILDPRTNIGKRLSEVVLTTDTVFDLEVLANRPDCMGHQGVAREIAAIYGEKLKLPEYDIKDKPKGDLNLTVKINNKKSCPRYSALILSHVEIKDSPEEIKRRLEAVGIRSLNNIVDITNYLMMDTGQPTHAFDYEKILGQKMVIREAKANEKMTTLDDKGRKLQKGMLVITDDKRNIDLAGIMGGKNSEISAKTTKIVLQAAVFEPKNVRRTSRALGLRTDAVSVYEKGVDLNNTLKVLARGLSLLKQQCPQIILEKIIDLKAKKVEPLKIKLHLEKLNSLIGLNFPEEKAMTFLKSFGLRVENKKKGIFIVSIPTFRPDITLEEDLIEEVARVYGYDRIPETQPYGEIGIMPRNKKLFWEKKIKNIFEALGFAEVINYSFYRAELIKKAGLVQKGHLEIENPLSEEQQYLRTCLSAGLLNNLKKNQKNFEEFKIYEMGKVFWIPQGKKVLQEKEMLAAMIFLKANQNTSEIFLQTKGIIELIFSKLGIDNYKFIKPSKKDSFYDQRQSVSVLYRDREIGVMGKISDKILKNFKINNLAIGLNFDLEKIWSAVTSLRVYQPLPKYPVVKRDLAIVINKKFSFEDIEDVIKKSNPLVSKVELFDIYEGAQLKTGQKNLAFHIIFQDPERTLEARGIDKIIGKIIQKLNLKFGAKIRTW